MDNEVKMTFVTNICKFYHSRRIFFCETVCPTNTYGLQCKQCGQCQIAQCDWTSDTGICFGECKAGYKGDNCQAGT